MFSNPEIVVLAKPENPRKAIAIAGRIAYTNLPVYELTDSLSEQDITTTINIILARRHWNVLRHVNYTVGLEDVSRALSHQLVRHHAGHSFTQRSQHYRTEIDASFHSPEIARTDMQINNLFLDAYIEAEENYNNLMGLGVKKEDARFVLPAGIATQLIWTFNLEAAMNFITQRACRLNTSEIMKVALGVRKILVQDIPELKRFLGPTCLRDGICNEGSGFNKCRRPWQSPVLVRNEKTGKLEEFTYEPDEKGD